MNLVLLAQRPLRAQYGAAEYDRIVAAVDALLAIRAELGIASQRYDPERGLSDFGVEAVALTELGLVAQLRAIDAALRARGGTIASLLIVGGAAIVPYGRLASPLADRDGPLISDCVYALASPNIPLSAWAVGRMPDAAPPLPGLLLAQLIAAGEQHRRGRAPKGQVVALVSAHWQDVSREVLRSVPDLALVLVPPHDATALTPLLPLRLVVCNLHGVREAVAWYGQAPGDTAYVAALRPADAETLPASAWLSQACFGGRVGRVAGQPTIAAALLASGVTTLVCAMGLTYGAIEPPIGDSDLLVAGFVSALAQPGIGAGAVLRSAQADMLRSALATRGRLDGAELKTLLSFMLYGDPTLEV
jgi:hypothetical protein